VYSPHPPTVLVFVAFVNSIGVIFAKAGCVSISANSISTDAKTIFFMGAYSLIHFIKTGARKFGKLISAFG
jgi:hypothetical protein